MILKCIDISFWPCLLSTNLQHKKNLIFTIFSVRNAIVLPEKMIFWLNYLHIMFLREAVFAAQKRVFVLCIVTNYDNVWVIEQEFYKIWSLLSSWPVTLSNEAARYLEVQSFFDGLSHSMPMCVWVCVCACVLKREKEKRREGDREEAWVCTSAVVCTCFGNHFHLLLQNTCNFPVIKSWFTSTKSAKVEAIHIVMKSNTHIS